MLQSSPAVFMFTGGTEQQAPFEYTWRLPLSGATLSSNPGPLVPVKINVSTGSTPLLTLPSPDTNGLYRSAGGGARGAHCVRHLSTGLVVALPLYQKNWSQGSAQDLGAQQVMSGSGLASEHGQLVSVHVDADAGAGDGCISRRMGPPPCGEKIDLCILCISLLMTPILESGK